MDFDNQNDLFAGWPFPRCEEAEREMDLIYNALGGHQPKVELLTGQIELTPLSLIRHIAKGKGYKMKKARQAPGLLVFEKY